MHLSLRIFTCTEIDTVLGLFYINQRWKFAKLTGLAMQMNSLFPMTVIRTIGLARDIEDHVLGIGHAV